LLVYAYAILFKLSILIIIFQQQNPEIDLSTFLQGSSATFHKYIEEGLAEIERNQNAGSAQAPDNRTGKEAPNTLFHLLTSCTCIYIRV